MNKILILFCSLFLLMTSCDKDYINPDDIEFSIIMPDTISLSSLVKIKGKINQDMKMKVFHDFTPRDTNNNMAPVKEHQIGELNPPIDSLLWDPNEANFTTGKYYFFWLAVTFTSSKKQKSTLSRSKMIYVKE